MANPVKLKPQDSLEQVLFDVLDQIKPADVNQDGVVDLKSPTERQEAYNLLHASHDYYERNYGPAALVLKLLDGIDHEHSAFNDLPTFDDKIYLSGVQQEILSNYLIIPYLSEEILDELYEGWVDAKWADPISPKEIDKNSSADEIDKFIEAQTNLLFDTVPDSLNSVRVYLTIYSGIGASQDNLPELNFNMSLLGLRRAFGLVRPIPGSSFDKIQNWSQGDNVQQLNFLDLINISLQSSVS